MQPDIPGDLPLPVHLRRLDHERMRRYADNLAFYEGSQWEGRERRGERRLTFNYARAFADKITSYLLSGHSVQVDAIDGADAATRDRARAAELALRAVEAENAVAQLDFETELDCAVLGDAAYKVTWDAEEGVGADQRAGCPGHLCVARTGRPQPHRRHRQPIRDPRPAGDGLREQ